MTLNLAAQKEQNNSYNALYKTVSALRKLPVIKYGTLITMLLNNDVFAFIRYNKYIIVQYNKKHAALSSNDIFKHILEIKKYISSFYMLA